MRFILFALLILQTYKLLPAKPAPVGGFGEPEYGDEECINAGDIVHNGLIYTPRQIFNIDFVDHIFKVILPHKIQQLCLIHSMMKASSVLRFDPPSPQQSNE